MCQRSGVKLGVVLVSSVPWTDTSRVILVLITLSMKACTLLVLVKPSI